MTGMATYYKPSQWRGKRVVYRSTDPDEPKRETVKAITFFTGLLASIAILWLFLR